MTAAAAVARRLGLPPALFTRAMLTMCAFNLLLHAKPSEPHLVPYLTGVKGFTPDQVWAEIFPVFTYSDAAFTLLAAPASQLLGCKRCVVAGALCRLATRFLLLWGRGLGAMQVMQVFYGAGVAAETVFNAYVFALVGPELYQAAASATAAATLLGFLLAAEVGQLALAGGASVTSLFYASLVTVGCGTAFSLALPADAAPAPSHGAAADAPASALARVAAAAASLRAELRACYATRPLRLLAFWWVAGSVAGSFTENYGTNLFFDIDPSDDANGHVTFVTRSLCCIAALAAVRLERGASEGGALTLAGGVAVAGVAIGALASATSLLPAYCAYAAALTALQFCTCVLYAQSAHALDDACANEGSAREEPADESAAAAPVRAPRGRTAVLFGANATVSLAVQSCVQAVAAAARAPPRAQFAVLSAYCFAVAAVTAAAAAALRSRTGTWRLVAPRAATVVASHAQDGDAGSDGDDQAGRELAPLLSSQDD